MLLFLLFVHLSATHLIYTLSLHDALPIFSMALFGTILTYYSAHGILGTDTLSGLNWSVLAGNAAQLDKPTMRLAFILILLGYGTKAGLAPMHTWKPDAYSEAPVPTAAILASAMLTCAL